MSEGERCGKGKKKGGSCDRVAYANKESWEMEGHPDIYEYKGDTVSWQWGEVDGRVGSGTVYMNIVNTKL